MKQISFIPHSINRREHGGSLLLGKRRKKRPLCLKSSHHLVLRSDFAQGPRSLLRHRPLINRIITKAKKRFDIKVYCFAIASNHIHISVKGKTRSGLQNFFRVVAGHIAQEILRECPIQLSERARAGASRMNGNGSSRAGGASQARVPEIKRQGSALNVGKKKAREKENRFWQTRIYSRIVSWGRDFIEVKKYIFQNHLEALGLIAYQPRKPKILKDSS
jgi:hypothetical protein